MATRKMTLALFVFAHFHYFLNVAALPKKGVYELEIKFPYTLEPSSDNSKSTFGENVHAYVYQPPKRADQSWKEYNKNRNYTVVLSRFNEKGVVNYKYCNIEFKSGQLEIFFEPLKYSLHNDTIVFAYISGTVEITDKKYVRNIHHNYRVLHMDTCKYYDANGIKTELGEDGMPEVNHWRNDVLYHDDKFDVFLPEAPCDGARCKYTFSDKGEYVSGPEPFLPADYKKNILKIYPSTKSIDHFVFVSDWKPKVAEEFPMSIDTTEFVGSQKLMFVNGANLTELTRFDYDYEKEKVVVKNLDGFLFVCRQFKSDNTTKINCMKFDENIVKFNATNIVSDGDKLYAIYNLPTGEILMAKGSSKGLTIEKWSLDNDVQEIYSTRDFELLLSVQHVILNVESDGAICIAMYYRGYALESINLLKKCYSKNVFSLV